MKKIVIIMGSNFDYPTMKYTEDIFNKFGIKYETKIISAHRTPELMFEFAKDAVNNYSLINYIMTVIFQRPVIVTCRWCINRITSSVTAHTAYATGQAQSLRIMSR